MGWHMNVLMYYMGVKWIRDSETNVYETNINVKNTPGFERCLSRDKIMWSSNGFSEELIMYKLMFADVTYNYENRSEL